MTRSAEPEPLLIRQAQLLGGATADVRLRSGEVWAIGDLVPVAGERVIDAGGGLLLPGLHDHHIHVAASAAALNSVPCGPPDVMDETALVGALAQPGTGWLRGIGYHESVAGMIDRDWLDAAVPDRPARIQHRSGRMWVFNSAALDLLLTTATPPATLEQKGGRWTGRLFDDDSWMRSALASAPPGFAAVGKLLAGYGITGITEMSPANDDGMVGHFAAEHACGALPQRVLIAGRLELGNRGLDPALALGPVKIHLHEEHLPPFDEIVMLIHAAHEGGRGVAVHCVTEVELVYTLAALREAGGHPADRIEHASIATEASVADLADLGLPVVAQPHFIAERGDAYRAMIPPDEWPNLYRLRSLRESGVVLAGGSDAPFGKADPWAAMAAAVTRKTASGHWLGESEALSPEAALALFLADPRDLARQRRIDRGLPADLCLLSSPWAAVRADLTSEHVRATLIGGRIVYNRINQAPAQRGPGINPPA